MLREKTNNEISLFRFASPFLDLMDELLGNEVVDEDEEG